MQAPLAIAVKLIIDSMQIHCTNSRNGAKADTKTDTKMVKTSMIQLLMMCK